MAEETISQKMAEQISLIMIGARERFTDRVKEYLKGKKIGIQEADKRTIEQLFSEYVQTYILAELAAVISFSIYSTSGNDDILTKIVPDLLDQIESKLGQIPDSMVKKTSGLPDYAKKVIEKKEEKSEVVASLLKDITEPQMRHLKASFDATLLAFMGE